MSDYVEIVALVEGPTEKIFIADMVAPYLAGKSVFMTPIIISKPGQKGGDVNFARVQNDIELHLKQREDTYLTLFIDFYGIKRDWPGIEDARRETTPEKKSKKFNTATKNKVQALFGQHDVTRRFISYVAMHDFEAMLFSAPQILAAQLHVRPSEIDSIISSYGSPENIDDSPQTAPAKRLDALSARRFKKTTTGIATAKAIGLEKIRAECFLFNEWLTTVENLRGLSNG